MRKCKKCQKPIDHNLEYHYCLDCFKQAEYSKPLTEEQEKELTQNAKDWLDNQTPLYPLVEDDKSLDFVAIKDMRFYYAKDTFVVTDELLANLEHFPKDDDQLNYYMYWDGDVLVIY